MKGTWRYHRIYTTVWLKFSIYCSLTKGTVSVYFYLMTAALYRSKCGIQRLHLERKKESEVSSRKRAPGPKQEHRTPWSPEWDGEWERKCVILLFLSLSPFSSSSVFLSVLPRSGVFSLFAGSLLVPFELSLSPLPAPPAGHDDDEDYDHNCDTATDGQRQEEEFGERGCGWQGNKGIQMISAQCSLCVYYMWTHSISIVSHASSVASGRARLVSRWIHKTIGCTFSKCCTFMRVYAIT